MDHNEATALRPPTRTRLADQVATVLLDAIVEGDLAADSLLPPERQLAEQLDVNRTSLRQAIARLEQMGVVETRQGRGTIVRDVAEGTDPVLIAHLLARDRRRMLVELFEIHEALAGLVGRLAAAHGTGADRARLRRALAAVEGADTAPDRQGAELAFFGEMVAMTRNRPLRAMQRWVDRAYGDDAADLFVDAFADAGPIVSGLEAVVDAVETGDAPRAEEATRGYAAASATRMLSAATAAGGRRGAGA